MTSYIVTITSSMTVEIESESGAEPNRILRDALRQVDLGMWNVNADLEQYEELEEGA